MEPSATALAAASAAATSATTKTNDSAAPASALPTKSSSSSSSSVSVPTWSHASDTSAFHPSSNVPLCFPPMFPNPNEIIMTAAAAASSGVTTATTDLVQHNLQLHHPYYPSTSSGLCHYQGYLPDGFSTSSTGNTNHVDLRPNQEQQQQQQYSIEEQIHHLQQLRRMQLLQQLQFHNASSHHVPYFDQEQQQLQQQQQLHHEARQATDEVHLPLKKRRIAKKASAVGQSPVEAATATSVPATSKRSVGGSSLDLSISSTSTSSIGNFDLSKSSSMTTEDERMAALTLMSAFGTRNVREDGSSVTTPVFDMVSTTGTATTAAVASTTTTTTMVPTEAFSEAAAAASSGMFMTTTAEQRHETWTPREGVSWSVGTIVDVVRGSSDADQIPTLVTPDAVPRTSVRRTIAVHPLLEEPMDSTNHHTSDDLPPEGSAGPGGVSSLQFPLSSSPESYHRQKNVYNTDDKYHFKALPDSTLTIRTSTLIEKPVSVMASESTTNLAFPTFQNKSIKTSNITSMHNSSEQSSQLEKSVPTKRVFHPKLDQPLPGGCHGKTSRNGGYCRRGPCFGGSKYCKLHYEHLARTGSPTIVLKSGKSNNSRSNSPSSSGGIAATSSTLHAKGKKGNATSKYLDGKDKSSKSLTCSLISQDNMSGRNETINGNLIDLPAPEPSSLALKTTRKSRHSHDRQFTGAPGQVRCQAITTRGRPCKYVAAESTSSGSSDNVHPKYCRMHANHETNPSQPRRVQKHHRPTEAITQSGPTGRIEPTRPKHDSFKSRHKKRKTKGKKAQKSPKLCSSAAASKSDSPVGLNSLPTAKWQDQKVTIATGPYLNHSGRVVKWNNGWVTVRVDSKLSQASDDASDDMYHNRRSFELLLC